MFVRESIAEEAVETRETEMDSASDSESKGMGDYGANFLDEFEEKRWRRSFTSSFLEPL